MTSTLPPAPPIDRLDRRLATLERRQRAGTRLVLAGLALGLLAAFGADDEPSVLRAERVELVDAEGRVRAELATRADGSAGLYLRGPEGEDRAALAHGESATSLTILDAAGTTRIGVSQFAHGGGGVALHGEDARGAAVLYLTERAGSLTFYDADGAVLLRQPR